MALVTAGAGSYPVVEQGYAQTFAPAKLQDSGLHERRQARLTINIFDVFHDLRERNVSQNSMMLERLANFGWRCG